MLYAKKTGHPHHKYVPQTLKIGGDVTYRNII